MSIAGWKDTESYYCTSDCWRAKEQPDGSWVVGRYEVSTDEWKEFTIKKENFAKYFRKVQP